MSASSSYFPVSTVIKSVTGSTHTSQHKSTRVNMSHDKCQLGLIEKVHEFVQTEADESM